MKQQETDTVRKQRGIYCRLFSDVELENTQQCHHTAATVLMSPRDIDERNHVSVSQRAVCIIKYITTDEIITHNYEDNDDRDVQSLETAGVAYIPDGMSPKAQLGTGMPKGLLASLSSFFSVVAEGFCSSDFGLVPLKAVH